MSTIITITLPWPDAALNPNSRSMWKKINAAKDARQIGRLETMAQVPDAVLPDGPLVCEYKFYPPSKRWFDDDNLISSLKNFRDGIFDNWATNDHAVVRTSGERCEVRKGGAVEVSIYSWAEHYHQINDTLAAIAVAELKLQEIRAIASRTDTDGLDYWQLVRDVLAVIDGEAK